MVKKNNKIETVIFHWSESIAITNEIDPDFTKLLDAQHTINLIEAENLISKAKDEMYRYGKYSIETDLTVHFSNGSKQRKVIDLKYDHSQLSDYF